MESLSQRIAEIKYIKKNKHSTNQIKSNKSKYISGIRNLVNKFLTEYIKNFNSQGSIQHEKDAVRKEKIQEGKQQKKKGQSRRQKEIAMIRNALRDELRNRIRTLRRALKK